MNSTTTQTTTVASEIYTHPLHLGQRALYYVINKKGQHVVMQPMVAGTDICDTIDRFETVTEARNFWKLVVTAIKSQGYIKEGGRS